MKRVVVFILCIFVGCEIFAQNADTIKVSPKPQLLSQEQRDSLLMRISKSADTVAASTVGIKECVGRYKMYRTSSIYINLKLDTATGEIMAVQIGMDKKSSRMEYVICEAMTNIGSDTDNIGRYELYPTGNYYNFILLDTAFGAIYQVQWSTNREECFRVII